METAIRELMGAGTPPRFKFKDTHASIEFPSGYTIPTQATLEAKYDELLALEEDIQKTVMEGDLEVGTSNLFVDTQTGNIGIGATSPSLNLHVMGGIKTQNNGVLTPQIQFGSGANNTNGWLVRANVSDTYAGEFSIDRQDNSTTPNKFVIKNNGNVGIGTNNPFGKLQVDIADASAATATWDATKVVFGDITNGNSQGLGFGVSTNSHASIISLAPGVAWRGLGYYSAWHKWYINNVEKMVLDASGKVGIGTTSPSHPLTIQETTTNTNTVTYPLAIRAISSGTVANGFGAGIRFQCERRDTDDYQSLAGSVEVYGGGGLPGTSDLWNMRFGVRNNDTAVTPMTLRYDGNVGIGTASPGYKLNVLTDTNYDGISLRDSTRELLKISKGNNGAYINMFESSVSKVNIATSGVSYLNGGNVGIGTTSPLSPLDIKAVKGITTAATANDLVSNATIRISGYAENHDVLCIGMLGTDTSGNSGNNPYAYIQNIWDTTKTARPLLLNPAGGNVGIGTTNPGYKLDVQGDINSTGKINMGNYAVAQGHMSSRTLTVGSTTSNYGGGNSWNANTAAILLECTDNTEIAAHDSGTRVSSLMYYEGASTNRITIGRDMGWGTIASVRMCGSQSYPNRPVAVVGKSNGRVYDPNVIVYNSVLYNDGGLYNTSNGRFTAPAGYAGYYLITYTGLGGYQETGPNTRWRLNGNDLSWGAAHINASPCTSRWGLTCQFIYYLNAGDYLTHRVISGSIYGSSSIHSTTVVMFMGSR
jgi:hypothetical protein